eukprot:jgi/Chrzof1/6602/Cz19g02090.t1
MLLCCYMCKGGKGAYAAFDAVGGKQAMDVVKALRRGGVCQVYGLLEPGPLQIDQQDLLMGGKTVTTFVIFGWVETVDKAAEVAQVLQLLEKKVMATAVADSFYPLARVKDALKESLDKPGGHKVFLTG